MKHIYCIMFRRPPSFQEAAGSEVDPMEYDRSKARLPEMLAISTVRNYISSLYDARYLAVALSRWKKGPQFPPVDVLINMARLVGTNVDYILGLTDVDAPMNKECEKEKTLEDLKAASGISESELLRAFNRDSSIITRYRKQLPLSRISSLISISEAFGLSVSYILDCTTWENWDAFAQTKAEYREAPAGSAMYIVTDKSVSSLSDVRRAISKDDGSYALVSDDGDVVIFSNGNEARITDKLFEGAFFIPLSPEV